MTAALRDVEDVYPLTPLQEGMLFHTIAAPGSGVYVDQILCRLDGLLDVDRLHAAWDAVVERHPALRTSFVWDGVDTPLQVVRRRVSTPWDQPPWAEVWPDRPAEGRIHLLESLLAEDRRQGFDLGAAPLVRMRLWREHDTSWRWLWTFHHLIADGWSARVVLRDVLVVYSAGGPDAAELGEPPAFREYVRWLGQRDPVDLEDRWRAELAGFTETTALTPPVAPVEEGRPGQVVHVELDERASDALRRTAADLRVTIGTVVQGAWALVLGQWAGTDDVLFGVTVSGRPPELPGVEDTVGLFINTTPRRVAIDRSQPVCDWLRGIQGRRLELGDVELTPLASVQRWSELPPGEPLFESIVVVENHPRTLEADDGEISIGELEFHEQSNYPLALLAMPGERLGLTLVYDGTRFDEAWVELVGRRLCDAIEQLIESPDLPLESVPPISEQDRTRLQVCHADNGGAAAMGGDLPVHRRLEAVARARPEDVAIVAGAEQVTYAELDRRANGLARRLREVGVTAGDRVGVSIARSPEMIVALFGVLKAAAAFVPLDPTYPEARNLMVAADADLTTVLDAAGPGPADDAPDADDDPARAAYVLYTSGSTGRPKGVEVTHANLAYSTSARSEHYGSDPGVFLLLSSVAFDSAMVGIFWTLCTGGTLVLPAPGEEHDVDRLGELVQTRSVTHVLALPTLYAVLLEQAGPNLGSLQVAIVAGETCRPSVVDQHFRVVPGAELHNEYGPTEATVWSTVHRVTAAERTGPVPIGRPIPGTCVHVLDRDRRPVPIGFAGELWVGGPGVCRGYQGRPDLTAERFADLDPIGAGRERVYRTGDLVCRRADGALLFLGRADSQLKVRGHRIEPDEVTAALLTLDGVSDATVRGQAGPAGHTRLVGYVVAPGDTDESDLRQQLETELPEFMVPDRILNLGSIPRLPNGKVDTLALPAPDHATRADATFVAPAGEIETTLARIWQDLLGIEEVSALDDFFVLGGDSIVSIQLISRARQAGIHLQPADVARHRTVAGLAATAAEATMEPAPDGGLGDVPLGPIQQWFFDLGLARPDHWNQSLLFEVPPDLDIDALREALAACMEHHPQLRARFRREGETWRQTVPDRPEPPLLETVRDEQALHAVQGRFELARTAPLRAAVWRPGPDRPGLLLIAVHHLVVDVVSWAILVDDLEAAYGQARRGEKVRLAPETVSYKEWVAQLGAAPDPTPAPEPSLPVDLHGHGFATEATARTMSVRFDEDTTSVLLHDIHEPYRTTVEDVLLTAVAAAIESCWGRDRLRLAVEAHGRSPDLDLARTVGWFTKVRIVDLSLPREGDPGERLTAVKEQLRAGTVTTARCRLGFNYLGRTDPAGRIGLLRRVPGAEASARHPDNERPHLLEVVAAVRHSCLQVDWQYSEARHHETTVAALADAFRLALVELVDWCRSVEAGRFTPSDFPEAELGQTELDELLDEIL